MGKLQTTAIFDTTVLVYFADAKQLDIFSKSNFLFDFILIPEAVKNEFARAEFLETRALILRNLRIDSGFYRLCPSFDTVVKCFVQDEIRKFAPSKRKVESNEGEAEAIAQAVKRQVSRIFTDDIPCQKAIDALFSKRYNIQSFNTLFLIALLELHGLIPNYVEFIQHFHKFKPFSSPQLRTAFMKAAELLGLNPKSKEIRLKYQYKKIFGARKIKKP